MLFAVFGVDVALKALHALSNKVGTRVRALLLSLNIMTRARNTVRKVTRSPSEAAGSDDDGESTGEGERGSKKASRLETDLATALSKLKSSRPYSSSRLRILSSPLTKLGLVTALIYLLEILTVFLRSLGFIPPKFSVSKLAASVLYASWLCRIVCDVKRSLIIQNFRGPRGQALLYNKIADYVVNTSFAFFALEVVAERLGIALKSFFAIGGVGAVVVGLACQGPVTQLVNGLILTLSDKIRPGDEVKFGDGTAGIVVSLDWFDLLLRGYDESMMRIPNSEIAAKRIHNISRDTRGQVKTTFAVRYRDIDRIPALIENIKVAIVEDCEKLITDGSRPFWVHWRDFEADHITVTVDVHFDIRHGTTAYYDVRMKVLQSIKKATTNTGIPFAMPARVSLPNEETSYIN